MSGLDVERIESKDKKSRIYRLKGALGETHFAYDLVEEMRKAFQEGLERIVLNLSKLDYITSSGVGIVASGYTSAQRAKKKFHIVGVTPRVRRVLDITGILDVVDEYETEEEALAA